MNERVKELRKALGLSMEKFAAPLGVQRNAISRIETRKSNLTEQMKKSICREYRVSEHWLETGEGEMFTPQHTDETLERLMNDILADDNSSFKRRFLTMLANLDRDKWDLIEQKIKELADDTPE